MTQATSSSSLWDVARLLAPVDPQSFLRDYWRQSCLHLARNSAGYYDKLLTRAELETFLEDQDFFLRTSVQTPNSNDTASARPPRALTDVHRELADGASLRVRHLEEWLGADTTLGCLVREAEAWLGSRLDSLTCYFAPTTSTGLGPHHDETEIFTLQVEGRKQWTFFGMGDRSTPARYAPETLPASIQDIVLEPGDLLYMPPGLIHEVRTVDDSLSLTLVFEPTTTNNDS